jgi:hypothetical protein
MLAATSPRKEQDVPSASCSALGFPKSLLMGGAVQRSMDAEEGSLERLKLVLEACRRFPWPPDP